LGFSWWFQHFVVILHPKHQEQSPLGGLTNRAIGATVVSTMRKAFKYSLQKFQVMQQHIYYIKFALRFADMQIHELLTVFNAKVQNRGWSSMRAYHDQALIDEFQRRGIDTTAVSDGRGLSFAHHVRYDMAHNRLIDNG